MKIKKFSLCDPLIKTFIRLPYELHRQSKSWVPPLRLQQSDILKTDHPFWQLNECQLALVLQNDRALGRIAFIYSKTENKIDRAYFGFFETVDDSKVSDLLFQFVKEAAQKKGVSYLSGPYNPGFNYELGILTQGVERPAKFMMPWHPAYYEKHFLQNNWQVEKTFLAYDLPVKDFLFPQKMQRIRSYLSSHYQIRFRNMNFANLESETKLIYDIYNEAFKTHWAYQYFSLAEIQAMAKDLKFIANRELLFFVYLNEQVAGFIIALPDLNEILPHLKDGRLFPFGWWKILSRKNKIKEVRVLNAAVRNQFKNRGIGTLLYHELHQRMKDNNYKSGELSWVAEDNKSMNNAVLALGARVVKAYRIFCMSV